MDVGPAADLPADFFEHAGAATPPQPQQPAAADFVPVAETAVEEEKPGELPKV